VTLDEAMIPLAEKPTDLVALDEALASLAEDYPRRSHVVELRYFGGLTNEEIAEVLGLKTSSLKALLHRARRRLAGFMTPAGEGETR